MSTTPSNYIPLVNGTGTLVVHGEVVRVSAANTFVRAQSPGALTGLVGVNGGGSIGAGGNANIFTSGAQIDVLLETGLTPVAGQTIYVSATVAGRATNVAPGTAVTLGTIENASQYAALKIVQVALALGTGGGTGAQGFQGSTGAQGAQGFQGVAGSGAQGAQGFQGATGAQGSQGTQGSQGAQGNGVASGTGLVRVDSGVASVDANATTLVTALEARWENVQQAFLNARIPSLTYESIRGFGFPVSQAGLANFAGDAFVGGGGVSGGSAAYRLYSLTMFNKMTTQNWAFTIRGNLPVPNATNDDEFGFQVSTGNDGCGFTSQHAVDTTHLVAYIQGSGGQTHIFTTHVIDAAYHDYSMTFDGTTVTVWVDGISVGTTTTLTHLPTDTNHGLYVYNNIALMTKCIVGVPNEP